VIDTHVGEHGEVIANIPIRISAKAVFSKFSISPINDINFGSMVVHSRKSASFTIENKGEFDFRYAVTKKLSAEQQQKQQQVLSLAAARNKTRSREGALGSARSSFVASKPPQIRNRTEGPVR
jgi:hydrocephalus-inducing protein